MRTLLLSCVPKRRKEKRERKKTHQKYLGGDQALVRKEQDVNKVDDGKDDDEVGGTFGGYQ